MEVRKEEISRLGMVLNEAFLAYLNERAISDPLGYLAEAEINVAYAASREYVLTILTERGLSASMH